MRFGCGFAGGDAVGDLEDGERPASHAASADAASTPRRKSRRVDERPEPAIAADVTVAARGVEPRHMRRTASHRPFFRHHRW
jgi:hypothetical protein